MNGSLIFSLVPWKAQDKSWSMCCKVLLLPRPLSSSLPIPHTYFGPCALFYTHPLCSPKAQNYITHMTIGLYSYTCQIMKLEEILENPPICYPVHKRNWGTETHRGRIFPSTFIVLTKLELNLWKVFRFLSSVCFAHCYYHLAMHGKVGKWCHTVAERLSFIYQPCSSKVEFPATSRSSFLPWRMREQGGHLPGIIHRIST